MARVLVLLTLLTHGRAAAEPPAAAEAMSAFRRGAAAARRRPGAPRDFIGRAELDGPLEDAQAEDVVSIIRVARARYFRHVEHGERRSARLRVGEAHEVTAPQLKMPSFPLVFQAAALF